MSRPVIARGDRRKTFFCEPCKMAGELPYWRADAPLGPLEIFRSTFPTSKHYGGFKRCPAHE